ncbi:MAG TPA: hypothetical protein VIJ65_05075 [Acidobacteriaceae bacterium]
MARTARMGRPAGTGGLKLAVGILILTFIWLALSVFHVFRTSPVHFPAWVGLFVGIGALVTPPLFTFAESLYWTARLSAALFFLGFMFVFSWFYHQHPVFYCIVILLLYLESYCIIPLLLKRRRRHAEQAKGD